MFPRFLLLFLLSLLIELSPAAAQDPPVLCPGTPPSFFTVGVQGQVAYFGDTLRLRSGPGTNSSTILEMEGGTTFTVIDGPQCGGAYTWWQIALPDGIAGWAAEGYEETYFIEPITDRSEGSPEQPSSAFSVSSENADFAPGSFSNGRIAFTNLLDNSRVYLINSDGSDGQPVSPEYAGCARFSPNGSYLLIRQSVNGVQEVLVDATRNQELVTIAGTGKFSPDGKYLAYARGNDGTFQLVLLDLASYEERILVGYFGGEFDWSPDSSEIVFNQQIDSPEEPQTLSAINVLTGNQRIIIGAANYAADIGYQREEGITWMLGNLEWFPNGEYIRFIQTSAMHVGPYTIVHADGSGFADIYLSARAADDWSPDGTQIVYTNQDGAPTFQLHVANVDGTNERLIYESPDFISFRALWSPDGQHIAFLKYDGTTRLSSIWIINPDGSGAYELPMSSEHVPVQWSPDSKQLLTTGEGSNIEIFALDGSEPILIGVGECPSWQPIPQDEIVSPPPQVGEYELRYTFYEGAFDIVELRASIIRANDDGTVVAEITIYNPTSIAYGVSFELLNGEIYGGAIEFLLENNDELPVLMPRVSQSLGTVTFYPDTELQITLGKFGFSPNDESYLRRLDTLTMLSVMGGVGYIPREITPEWYWRNIVLRYLKLVDVGYVDEAASLLLFLTGDSEERNEEIAGFLTDHPDLVVNYVKNRFGREITIERVQVRDTFVALQYASIIEDTLEVVDDFVSSPELAWVILYTQPVLSSKD